MTKQARPQEEIEKVKNQIIDEAVHIITHKGFESLTMRGIASRMKMTATNLYNYFQNKDEIYINIMIKGFRELYQDMETVYATVPDPRERSRQIIRHYLQFGIEKSHYYDVMFTLNVPKYNDYLGTSLEALSSIERDYSKKIISLATKVSAEMLMSLGRKDLTEEIITRRMVSAWAMLHGMIVLYHSKMIEYTVTDPMQTYDIMCDEIIDFLTH